MKKWIQSRIGSMLSYKQSNSGDGAIQIASVRGHLVLNICLKQCSDSAFGRLCEHVKDLPQIDVRKPRP